MGKTPKPPASFAGSVRENLPGPGFRKKLAASKRKKTVIEMIKSQKSPYGKK